MLGAEVPMLGVKIRLNQVVMTMCISVPAAGICWALQGSVSNTAGKLECIRYLFDWHWQISGMVLQNWKEQTLPCGSAFFSEHPKQL